MMKRVFEEPEARKILINLKESIADGSGGPTNYVTIVFATMQAMSGCMDYISDTLPNPGAIVGDSLERWIIDNAGILANCSVSGVQELRPRLFAAASPQSVARSSAVYDVPKDIADTYGMVY